MENYFENTTIFNFLIWIGTSLSGYILGNIYLKTKIKNTCDCCQSCLITDNEGYLRFSFHNKTNKQKAQDLTSFILYSLLYFTYSNINNRIDYHDPYQLFYILLYFSSIFIFGLFCEIRGLQTSCSTGSVKKWPMVARIVYSLIGIIVLGTFGYHLYLAYDEKIIFYYVISILTIILYYIFIYYYYVNKEEHNIHIHHWFLGHMASLYFRFNNTFSNIAFMISYGIFTQGLVNYGITDIFTT